ncbi:MAG: prepilin-type N-terminal cleavage/methylation domain-containing protein [Planctomycetota bacterium]
MKNRNSLLTRAFTLIELLVVIAVIAVLLAILLPSLSSARTTALATQCSSNLKQLGAGLAMYLGEYPERLPQVRVDLATGEPVRSPDGNNIGALFGGKLGSLPGFPGSDFGINKVGAERRPLNAYVWDGVIPPDNSPNAADFELPVFQSPADKGLNDPLLLSFGIDTSSTYDLLGSSYNLNDHALDDDGGTDRYPTLIPERGGRMPPVDDTSKTWLLGSHPIYNYDDGGDRGQRWYLDDVRANLLFVDLHAELMRPVPEGIVQTTPDYTFLPQSGWLRRFE